MHSSAISKDKWTKIDWTAENMPLLFPEDGLKEPHL